MDLFSITVGAGAAFAICGLADLWRDRRATPAPAPIAQSEPGAFDEARVREQLRANDQRGVTEAYQRTFAGDQGRFVLAHILATCGVGQRQGPGVPAADRHYFAGRQDAAIELMNAAGFDQPSAVLATMTDTLEGQTHDRYAASPNDRDLADL